MAVYSGYDYIFRELSPGEIEEIATG